MYTAIQNKKEQSLLDLCTSPDSSIGGLLAMQHLRYILATFFTGTISATLPVLTIIVTSKTADRCQNVNEKACMHLVHNRRNMLVIV